MNQMTGKSENNGTIQIVHRVWAVNSSFEETSKWLSCVAIFVAKPFALSGNLSVFNM
jgi:hypothetical protein